MVCTKLYKLWGSQEDEKEESEKKELDRSNNILSFPLLYYNVNAYAMYLKITKNIKSNLLFNTAKSKIIVTQFKKVNSK